MAVPAPAEVDNLMCDARRERETPVNPPAITAPQKHAGSETTTSRPPVARTCSRLSGARARPPTALTKAPQATPERFGRSPRKGPTTREHSLRKPAYDANRDDSTPRDHRDKAGGAPKEAEPRRNGRQHRRRRNVVRLAVEGNGSTPAPYPPSDPPQETTQCAP